MRIQEPRLRFLRETLTDQKYINIKRWTQETSLTSNPASFQTLGTSAVLAQTETSRLLIPLKTFLLVHSSITRFSNATTSAETKFHTLRAAQFPKENISRSVRIQNLEALAHNRFASVQKTLKKSKKIDFIWLKISKAVKIKSEQSLLTLSKLQKMLRSGWKWLRSPTSSNVMLRKRLGMTEPFRYFQPSMDGSQWLLTIKTAQID